MQGDLFQEDQGLVHGRRGIMPARGGPIAGAPPLPPGLRMGTSSWSFAGWEGLVYEGRHGPGGLAGEGLAAYGSHPLFRTVGVDRSYYRPLSRDVLVELASQVPQDFRFVVKAPVQVTGPRLQGGGRGANPDFLDSRLAASLAVDPFLESLGERAGILLFQFPPMGIRSPHRGQRFLEHLGTFLKNLPRGPVYAVEVRDRILWGGDFHRTLLESGAIPGYAVHPSAPGLAEQIRLMPPHGFPVTLVRWLLPPGSGYEEAREAFAPFRLVQAPDPAHREMLVQLARDGVRSERPTYIIVNNKAEGSAPLSVLALAEALREEGGG